MNLQTQTASSLLRYFFLFNNTTSQPVKNSQCSLRQQLPVWVPLLRGLREKGQGYTWWGRREEEREKEGKQSWFLHCWIWVGWFGSGVERVTKRGGWWHPVLEGSHCVNVTVILILSGIYILAAGQVYDCKVWEFEDYSTIFDLIDKSKNQI